MDTESDSEAIGFRTKKTLVASEQAEIAKTLIESVGAKIKFLPPYSPDLSPIELCWSKLKEIIRSAKARTIETLDSAITMAINAITDEDALNWFHHCGIYFDPFR
ncbi:MAG: transposase [Pseudanabaena sp. ELA607]